jgi:CubicO group peptidase (beta-lactamase class C family)
VAVVQVSPDTTVLVPSGTRQFTAVAKDASGNTLSGRTIVWSIAPAAVATVNDGLVTAVAAGSAQLTAQSEGKSGTATVTVLDGGVVGAPGGTVSRADGAVVLEVPAGALSQSTVITIAASTTPPANPLLVAGTAYDFGPSGTTFAQPVTVRLKYPAASAVGADATKFRLHRYAANAWQEIAGSTVDVGNRIVTGQTTSFSRYAILSLPAAPVGSVVISPDSSDVAWRGTRTLAAATLDGAGGPLTGRVVTWLSSDPTIATVNEAGVVTGLVPGGVTITATSETKSGTARVRVVPADVSAQVESIRQAHNLPAMGAAIVSRNGGVMAIGVSGTRRVGGGPPVTIDDKWHIGSNTKAITGILAAMAVEAGVIAWNKTVEQAFPESAAGMLAAHRPITLLDLINNQSGVVNSISGLPTTSDPKAGRDAWADWTVRQGAAVTRGTYYYSNNGFAMAGGMVERAWGSTYEALLATRLFQPLGVVGAGWGPTTAAGNTDQPIGHQPAGSGWTPCDGCDNRAGLSSAGTMHVPLAGWARIIQELMRADAGQSTLLSQTAARQLSAPGVAIGNGTSYSHGWVVQDNPGNRVLSHDGSNTTNRSRALVYLDGGVAYLLTTNAGDPAASGGAPNAGLNALQTRMQQFRQTGQ